MATVIHYADMILQNQSTGEQIDENNVGNVNPSTKTTAPTVRPRCRLYLSHFPMSISLQYSLRRETTIQAYNVQLLHSQPNIDTILDQKTGVDSDTSNETIASYGTCLRSTLVVLKHGTDVTMSSIEEQSKEQSTVVRKQTEQCVNEDTTSVGATFSTQPCEHFDTSNKSKSLVVQSIIIITM